MAERPISAPRRDELALGGNGTLSQRLIVYLEDVASITNDTPQEVEDEIISSLLGSANINIVAAQLSELIKSFNDNNNLVSGLIDANYLLISDNNNVKDKISDLNNHISSLKTENDLLISLNRSLQSEIEDIKQIQTGGFNGG